MLLYFTVSSGLSTTPSDALNFSVVDKGVSTGLQFFIPACCTISEAYRKERHFEHLIVARTTLSILPLITQVGLWQL